MDVGNANYDPPTYRPIGLPLSSRPDKDDVRRALEFISRSENPVIVAGGGVMLSGAFAEVRMFAETLAIPVLTTASGRGSGLHK